MLDLTKISQQMQGISQHLIQEAGASRQRLERAQQHLQQASTQQADLVKHQQMWRDRISFNAAMPVEPLDTRVTIDIPPASHTVIATDGSQIAPSHHEIAYCYLINVGRVMLHYGQSLYPLLDSLPEVFYQPEDLYISNRWGISTEEWMGYRRTVSEASVLAELACSWVNPQSSQANLTPPTPLPYQGRGEFDSPLLRGEGQGERLSEQYGEQSNHPKSKIQNPKSQVPILAMLDGSLIYWFLDQMPMEARDRILPPILDAWNQLRLAGVPLMGYLSASRSIETVSFLRFTACTHPVPDCNTYCAGLLDKTPCHVFGSLKDAVFWMSQLQPGQRSPLWRSTAKITDLYDIHSIYFCYVHVGTEIARIDVPAWVAENSVLLNQSLSLMLAQVHKGYGYPIALSEAHNHAVVKGGDRTRFFALLEQQMIKAGLRNVGTSYKEARKRGSIA